MADLGLASCKPHSSRYMGQTYDQKDCVGPHYDQRQDCQSCIVGLGQHFYQQYGGCMEEMEVVIIDSVQPGNHDLLDLKEDEWVHRLRTIEHMRAMEG